jgi:rhodanese-related sulfurtransferase
MSKTMKGFIAWAFGIERDDNEIMARLAKGAVVIDARTSSKYTAGHAYNAINLPTGLLSASSAYEAVRSSELSLKSLL